MPIPKPKDTEKKSEFIRRCMNDDIMINEYPDKEQRYSICITQFKEK